MACRFGKRKEVDLCSAFSSDLRHSAFSHAAHSPLSWFLPGQRRNSRHSLVRFAILWASAFLLVAIAEEFLFRGYSLYTLTRNWLLAGRQFFYRALFGAIHLLNGGEDWIGAITAADASHSYSFSACGAPEISGSPSECTPRGIGQKASFTAFPTVDKKQLGTLFNPHFKDQSGSPAGA